MTLKPSSLDTLARNGVGMDHPDSNVNDLRDCLAQLRGLTFKVPVGGAAGNITVTGIATTDHLWAVINIDIGGDAITDLTSEFTISAANTINNTGGTSSAGGVLLVVYSDLSAGA